MAWHSTTDTFSGVDDHTTVMRVPKPARPARTRGRGWPVWVLPTLAFVCGALVSAAVFTIGWRQQTQQNAAAQSALVAAIARNHTLSDALAASRAKLAREEKTAAQALASVKAAQTSGATIAAQSRAAQANASSVSGSASAVASTAGKIASELKTLTTYLTTTPSSQLDAGYVESQTAYLARQVAALQSDGATTAAAAATFTTAIQKLGRLAAALSTQK
jgi:hypothetical protein